MAITRQQAVVLRMLAQGRTPKEVAAALCLADNTVHAHIDGAKKRLKARTTIHAVCLWLRSLAEDKAS